jgi:hypothetical protein
MLVACPTECPLAAYAIGRPVVIDLDNLAAPTDRRVPRRCRRCHRYFRPGARGPLATFCGRKCANAAGQLVRDREAAYLRMPSEYDDSRHGDVIGTLGADATDPERTRGYVYSAAKEARLRAQMLRRMSKPFLDDEDEDTAALAYWSYYVEAPYLSRLAARIETADR